MKKFRARLIHLHRTQCMSRKQLSTLLTYDPQLKKVHKLTPHDFQRILSLTYEKALNLYKKLHSKSLQQETLQVMKDYAIITIVDDVYPNVLKTIQDPPIVLYAKGNINLLKEYPMLSVIGTRNPSVKAKEKLQKIVEPIIKQNWIIVSGMALGIDSYAHESTLTLGGKTIAVLGSGFNHIYPRKNEALFHAICQHGLVLSEYPPHLKPTRYRFPERNRIISGLSFGTLVVEATKKSGTLITVNQALDQGREVYAVPDSPLVKQAEGCNMLIKEGATLVTSAEVILQDWKQHGHHLFLLGNQS